MIACAISMNFTRMSVAAVGILGMAGSGVAGAGAAAAASGGVDGRDGERAGLTAIGAAKVEAELSAGAVEGAAAGAGGDALAVAGASPPVGAVTLLEAAKRIDITNNMQA